MPNEDAQPARRTIADILADPGDTVPTPVQADVGIQAGAHGDAEEWTIDLDKVRETRSLLEEFKHRLEEVEERVGAMEAEWYELVQMYVNNA